MSASSPTRTVRFDLTARLVEVTGVQDIARDYRRITFGGDALAGFQSLDPDDHFKLALPAHGEALPVLPVFDKTQPAPAADAPRPILRDYTPRHFDASANLLDVDFVLHGDGPAATWAAQATVGQQVGVIGPRGSHILEDAFDWYLMIGDETVLPSIARRLEEAQDQTIVAFIEVNGVEDEQPLITNGQADLHWIYRQDAEPGASTVLLDALRSFSFPAGTCFVWAGGEATTLRAIRRYLLNERNVPPERTSFSGHWKRGVANHDHHEPIE